MPTSDKAGRLVARGLGIDLDHRARAEPTAELRSAARRVDSLDDADIYFEREPTVAEWFREHRPTRAGIVLYLKQLFPFWAWIFHYNATWLMGDIVAGVTVGFVVIPQGMAYALLAQLPAEYGLYTSFVGFLVYWAFATSKDITIGTVAVMSQLVGNIVIKVQAEYPQYSGPDIARSLALIAGAILMFIGLVRIGWLVEFIPLVAISSFMTGAAINIAAGQVPKLMGIAGVNTRGATYVTIIETLRKLPTTSLDAAVGLTALFVLYAIRWACGAMSERQPHRRKLWFFVSTLRMAFVILLYILIGYLANRGIQDEDDAVFAILGTVPSGFKHVGLPVINTQLIGAFAPELPATIIVLIIEHIAISKSFGRVNNYVINPSQELIAVGLTNIVGPFLGAYPATGSFSRTAIKSKAGVRTPLAGLFTAVIVLLALYALTRMFFYIPMASLAAIIIHAVGDLISPPSAVYRFWELSPLEVVIFFGGVIITIFTSIEIGIYFTVACSAALLLWRIARARGDFVGRVRVRRVRVPSDGRSHEEGEGGNTTDGAPRTASSSPPQYTTTTTYVPYDHHDGSNPNVDVQTPHPGVFVFRFREAFNYLNQAHLLDQLVTHVLKATRRTTLDTYAKLGDRPWNDPGPRRGEMAALVDDARPVLRAVVLDMSACAHIDVTSVQGLVDIRNQLDRHAAPVEVEWHFAHVHSRWTRRALAVAGFGYPATGHVGRWRPVFSIAAAADAASVFGGHGSAEEELEGGGGTTSDEEKGIPRGGAGKAGSRSAGKTVEAVEEATAAEASQAPPAVPQAVGSEGRLVPVTGVDRPFFHLDVAAAVESVLENVRSGGR